ncbi:MAG: hypothetical protein IKW01_02015 [Firmicutes bacterium]|nr:hypothetical protein [Bacillota bacterium]
MPKYEVRKVFTEDELLKMRSKILDARRVSEDLDMEKMYEAEAKTFEDKGIEPLETVFVGPFTAREYMKATGAFLDRVPSGYEQFPLVDWAEENLGAYRLVKKDIGNGQFVFDFSNATKEEMKKMKTSNPEDLLTAWDKLLGFFGFKTDHARSVELSLAGIEAIKAKKEELNKNLLKEKREAFVKDHLDKHVPNKKLLSETKIALQSWREIFFGPETSDNKVPDYVLDNGKKVSALSLCMASLQQYYKNDLSAISPMDFIKEMETNEKLAKRVETIGSVIRDMASKSNMKRFKYLDSFLDTSSSLMGLDNKLKEIMKPKGSKPIAITTAADYKGMSPESKAESVDMLAQASIMFSMKEDMLKVFGDKNDPIYSMKDENGKPKDPAAADVERHAKASLKAAVLCEAIIKEDYDKLLKETGFGDNYEKLEDAFKIAEDMINEASKGVVEKTKEEVNEIEEDEIDFAL